MEGDGHESEAARGGDGCLPCDDTDSLFRQAKQDNAAPCSLCASASNGIRVQPHTNEQRSAISDPVPAKLRVHVIQNQPQLATGRQPLGSPVTQTTHSLAASAPAHQKVVPLKHTSRIQLLHKRNKIPCPRHQ